MTFTVIGTAAATAVATTLAAANVTIIIATGATVMMAPIRITCRFTTVSLVMFHLAKSVIVAHFIFVFFGFCFYICLKKKKINDVCSKLNHHFIGI